MTILTRNTDILRAEVAAHIKADAVVPNTYWDGSKGSFIGCLTHSSDASLAFERFGLPEPLLRIAENIFEALPDEEGRAFFAALPDAVARDGKDLTRVHWAFVAAELRALPHVPANIQSVIDPVIAGMDILAGGGIWDTAASAARSAYATATATATYAAYVYGDTYADAACAARAAAYAARSADVAADAAYAAAYAADATATATYAAYAYVYGDTYAARLRQRDTLLRLISEAS